MADLYNEDFLWGTSIQTAHLQGDRRVLYPKRDKVLNWLITMGVQDIPEKFEEGMSTRGRDVPISLEMRHSSSIGNRLLRRIEIMEKEVGRADSTRCSIELTLSPRCDRSERSAKTWRRPTSEMSWTWRTWLVRTGNLATIWSRWKRCGRNRSVSVWTSVGGMRHCRSICFLGDVVP